MRQGLQDMTIETLNYKVKYLERNGSLTLLERIDAHGHFMQNFKIGFWGFIFTPIWV